MADELKELQFDDGLKELKFEELVFPKSSYAARPRTLAEYLLPSFLTSYQEKAGERTLLGDIFERPGAAVRAGIQALPPGGESPFGAYQKGTMFPEEVPTFQDILLNKYYGLSTESPSKAKVAGGFGVSAVGLGADIITNPADALLTLTGLRGAKEIEKLKPTAIGRFLTRERHIPRVFGEKWISEQASRTRQVAKGLDDSLHNVYQNFYKTQGLGDTSINPSLIDEALLRNNIPNPVLTEIDNTIGQVNTISKAQDALQIINKRLSEPIWQGRTTLIGGEFNPKLASINTWKEIKSIIRSRANEVNPELGAKLQQFDDFASKNIYPKINKMYSWVGRRGEPETETLFNIFAGGTGKASKRGIIRETPKATEELKKYFNSKEFTKDINELLSNARQLGEEMKSFRLRQATKLGIGVGVGGGGILWLINRLLGER